MQNLDQIRAAAALAAADSTTRQAVSKLPAMILQNGLLAATAFATERKDAGDFKRPEMAQAMVSIAKHVTTLGIVPNDVRDVLAFPKALSSATSLDLQRATTESLAFLSFLKRFTTKDAKPEN